MPTVGDRVIVEGNKVGQLRREGSLLRLVGPLIEVEWTDGTTSLFRPAAGSVIFEPGGRGKGAPRKGTPGAGNSGARGRGQAASRGARKPGGASRGARKPGGASRGARKPGVKAKPGTRKR